MLQFTPKATRINLLQNFNSLNFVTFSNDCLSTMYQVESTDLISYGLIPEFVGRFPILVNLSALTEDQFVEVNTCP